MAVDESDLGDSSATVPPGTLFVAADEPLLVFPSVSVAESHLETIDVENGVYPAAFGPNGEPYRVGIEGNRVVIELTGEPNRPDELRALLVRYLQAVGQSFDEHALTSELAVQVWELDREFWDGRLAKPVPLSCCAAFVLIPGTALYVLITRDWAAIPFVIILSLLFWGVAKLARRRADQLDFRRD